VHGVEPVAQLGVVAREQVAVPVEREAHRCVAGPDADLLGVGARRDPQCDRGVAKVVRAQWRQASRAHGREPDLDAEVRGPKRPTPLGSEDVGVGRADRPL
jgi:hypothetical protein